MARISLATLSLTAVACEATKAVGATDATRAPAEQEQAAASGAQGDADAGEKPGAVTAPPAAPERFALVPNRTVFYASADASAGVVTRSFRPRPTQGAISARHIGWVMRVEEERGERVRVQTLPGSEPQNDCGRGFAGLEAFELSVWVERDSLMRVTTEVSSLSFPDGSSIVVSPGLGVFEPELPGGKGVQVGPYVSSLELLAWEVQIPLGEAKEFEAFSSTLGTFFELAERPAITTDTAPTPPDGQLQLAGMPMTSPQFNEFEHRAKLVAVESVDDKTTVTYQGRCLDVEAVTMEGVGGLGSVGGLRGVGGAGRGARDGGGGYGDNPAPIEISVSEGAAVRWSDGTVAGQVRQAITLQGPQAPGEGRCAYVSVGDKQTDLVLCFDAE